MTTLDIPQIKNVLRDFFKSFYEEVSDGTGGKKKHFVYDEQISKLASRSSNVFYLALDDLNETNPDLVDKFSNNSVRFQRITNEVIDELINEKRGNELPEAKDALDAYLIQRIREERHIKTLQDENMPLQDSKRKFPPELLRRYDIAIKTPSSDKPFAVRNVKSKYIGKLITVTGIVIRATDVRPLTSVLTYSCDTCGCETYQTVKGPSFQPAIECPSRECQESRGAGRLTMQIRGSKFTKFQEIRIQESSNQVPIGSIPRSMTINLFGEQCREVVPGDSVRVSGTLLPIMSGQGERHTGSLVTDTFLQATDLEKLNTDDTVDDENSKFTEEELELASKPDIYDQLAYSIAPEIYGHIDVKKSLLLALVGGVDKNAAGMKIRGNINVILMGDPGVAKSQLLGYVDRLAVRSAYTTGRGSSGVGLTAAVIKDPITGEMTLEGGALVLADGGICCIDEFDKMLEGDRTAIHEVMEQQTISIAKAGILTTLNARTSIIAAANPAYGRFNPKRSIEENLQLPAALLSRFDILWLIQDKPSRENDKRLASHITFVHMNEKQPEQDGRVPLSMSFMRKYIAICKKKNPTVSPNLSKRLVDMYVDLRKHARISNDSTYTSPRVLLGVIRMATAVARVRLADEVTMADIEEAIRLMDVSKSSLHPDDIRGVNRYEHVWDNVFEIIRDIKNSSVADMAVSLSEVVGKSKNKGIREKDVDEAIKHFSKQGVLFMDESKKIHVF
ncbi:DNA replication licensing factor MCM7 [Strongyloides ratti]|uniref:DNA replication licensing factor MCM7 n=1 Tax=Strongyloides ratti TaxID=34506 RepID=A0A090LD96_STRRB|nr:DNA replication licensing factor MCM7 [Strongyloides ratti]CEF67702.1 DNA replication licensing factor MCM7 [Strongyloides ratti]